MAQTRINGSDDTNGMGKGPNKLAERMAMIRAGESRRPEGERICYDPYAIRFVGPELGKLLAIDQQQRDAAIARLEQGMPGLTNSVVARARFFDDTVRQAVADGIGQLVILGAGYDTRAYRIDGLKKIQVFEVDQPDTVAVKKDKIQAIFGSLPGHVIYVPIDFNVEKLDSRLRECGYDPSKKTLFTLEGLIMYLDPGAVDGLLAFIAHNSGKGSAVAFDYGRTHSEITSAGHRKESQATRKFTESQGDTMRFAMAGPVEAFLAERGFRNTRNMTDDDYKKAYFTGNNSNRNISGLLWFVYAEID
jgi:methyltransferase (TIGR00027 family)